MPNSNAFEMQKTLLKLRQIHLETERDTELRKNLDRLLQHDSSGRLLPVPVRFTGNMETRGIMMVEGSGGGKTTALRKVLSEHPALLPNKNDDFLRVVSIQVPSPATMKSLGLAILAGTGMHDLSERSKAWDIWKMVKHRFGLLGTVVLWINEAQDMFFSGQPSEIDNMLKTIKSLMQNETAVIVILSGTERLSDVTAFDPQVNRRFAKITPRDLVSGGDEQDLLGSIVSRYCEIAGLSFDAGGNVTGRLIHGSRGRFGRALETVLNAIECALFEKADELTRLHFASAWEAQEGCAWKQNVFVIDEWRQLRLDETAAEFEFERKERQFRKLGRA
ncbi:ATP-binding protein [Parasedimentitalea maritima]|uniref:ATP-binding protein n=1 Tax=Parasedimentitalea maritima TaxID=2578117 RepID=A0ABY2USX4_9RHOB|nr:TniB family NTP-binding protein [Zongyanglinia marina]TLP58514.1 ATP-binding protein [Zongyanglinia marina]